MVGGGPNCPLKLKALSKPRQQLALNGENDFQGKKAQKVIKKVVEQPLNEPFKSFLSPKSNFNANLISNKN